jgi:hypothetical protein
MATVDGDVLDGIIESFVTSTLSSDVGTATPDTDFILILGGQVSVVIIPWNPGPGRMPTE